jgi:hypothetical protein
MTFKDDGMMTTYYREYNKECNGTGDKTLVGNWVEERALRAKEDTGRYKLWVNGQDDPTDLQKTYTKKTERPDGGSSLNTFSRTFAHDETVPVGFWMSSNEVPEQPYNKYVAPGKGAREAVLERRAREIAQAQVGAEVEREARVTSDFNSTYQLEFTEKELPDQIGTRRKGTPDLLWRKEAGLTDPSRLPIERVEPIRRHFGKNDTFSRPVTLAKEGAEKDA